MTPTPVRERVWSDTSILAMDLVAGSATSRVRHDALDRTMVPFRWGYPDWVRALGAVLDEEDT